MYIIIISSASYHIMQSCWQLTPSERPTFTQMRTRWECMLEQDGDYLQMDHIDYEMYSAVEPLSSSSSLEDDSEGRAVHLDTRRPVVAAEVTAAVDSRDEGGKEGGGECKSSVDDITVEFCVM